MRRTGRAALVLTVVVTCWSLSSAVDAERRRWGDTVPVLVATVALQPGDTVDAVRVAQWPVALAPPGALAGSAADLGEATVMTRSVGVGEVLVADDVGRRAGVAGLIPDGWSAVPVPAGPDQRTLVSVGDSVTVVVGARTLATGAVVAVGDESVTVAVPDRAAASLVDGVLQGTAALALTP